MLRVVTLIALVAVFTETGANTETSCNTNEVWRSGNHCTNECGSLACDRMLTHGCFCISGYKKNSDGVCVPISECPTKKKSRSKKHLGGVECARHEAYKKSNRCLEECNSMSCGVDVYMDCFCKEGYKRHNAKCIREDDCPKLKFTKRRSRKSSKRSKKVFNGANSNPYPFIISIQLNHNHACGGSIITPSWVLSAGHCVTAANYFITKYNAFLTIVAGAYDWTDRASSGNWQTRKVAGYRLPEGYDIQTIVRDISLLKVERPFVFNSVVNRIHLPLENLRDPTGNAVVIGWGSTVADADFFEHYSNVLQELTIPIHSAETCQKYIEKENTICAGKLEGGEDSCGGDSGGPLFKSISGQTTVVGIVSHGTATKCGDPEAPAVYTEVLKYRDWIDDTVDAENPETLDRYYTYGDYEVPERGNDEYVVFKGLRKLDFPELIRMVSEGIIR